MQKKKHGYTSKRPIKNMLNTWKEPIDAYRRTDRCLYMYIYAGNVSILLNWYVASQIVYLSLSTWSQIFLANLLHQLKPKSVGSNESKNFPLLQNGSRKPLFSNMFLPSHLTNNICWCQQISRRLVIQSSKSSINT